MTGNGYKIIGIVKLFSEERGGIMNKHKSSNDVFKKNQKGFTLVEIVIAVSLISIIMIVAYSVFDTSVKWYYREVNINQNQNMERETLSLIVSELRKADSCDLVLENKIKIQNSTSGEIIIYQDGSNVKVEKSGNIYNIAEKIDILKFTKDSDKVTIQIKRIPYQGETVETLTSVVILR